MSALLKAIKELESFEIIESNVLNKTKATGMVYLSDAIDALQKLEVAVKSECECVEVERLITDKAY